MSTGRGNLLKLLSERVGAGSDTTSNDESSSNKDSGVAQSLLTTSAAKSKRSGRGTMFDCLGASMSDLSIGRGTAIDSQKSSEEAAQSESLSVSSDGVRARGHGRAQAILSMTQLPQTIKESSPPAPAVAEKHLTAYKQEIEEVFYKPQEVCGSAGDPTTFACNYIRLQLEAGKGVYYYDVKFSPVIDSIGLRSKLLNQHRERFPVKHFDGENLYMPDKLANNSERLISRDEMKNIDVEIRLEFKRKETPQQCMHIYNVLLDRVMKILSYVRCGRKQFDPTEAKILPKAKLEIWPGYVTAVDEYDGGLMLCCDVSHRVLFQKTVLETLGEIYRKGADRFHDQAKQALLGSMVITRYNNRTYRIDDISFDLNPMSTFETRNGPPISYYDYYKRTYNIEIKDRKQPLLISIKKQQKYSQQQAEDINICLIPEVCFLTGMRDELRSDHRLLREMASFTNVTPNQRLLALEKFHKNVNNNEDARAVLAGWGLKLDMTVQKVQGRVFKEEQIKLAKRAFPVGPQADFSRHVVTNQLLEVVHLRNWILVHWNGDRKAAENFWYNYENCASALGVEVTRPTFISLDHDRTDAYVNVLRNKIARGTQLVVCICPTRREDRYSAIKRICCSEIPIPSQVINARTLANESKNRSIVQKIALQINCKLGGSLWSINIPLANTMICGVDAYHDAGQKGKSVVGFTASLNSTYSKWYSKTIIQTKREELVKGMGSALAASLCAYEKANGRSPEKIIIFRDGVGDGQFQYCNGYEIPQLESACNLSGAGNSIKITYVVVQKRINTRFFAMQGENSAGNPPPGSVVDSKITRANLYDFFLVSQSTRQGTVSPTHYVVLRDDSAFKPDILQRLSYKLCFLYYNWPGTIRSPACCQYAHKMAALVGQSIGRMPSEDLATKLYYL